MVGGVTLPLFNSRGLLKMVRASLASPRYGLTGSSRSCFCIFPFRFLNPYESRDAHLPNTPVTAERGCGRPLAADAGAAQATSVAREARGPVRTVLYPVQGARVNTIHRTLYLTSVWPTSCRFTR